MKTSFFSFITFGALALTAWASPIVPEAPAALNAYVDAKVTVGAGAVEAKVTVEDVDVILASLYVDVQLTNKNYNATCKAGCTQAHIKLWSKELAGHCHKAIAKCKKLPSGHIFPDKQKCVNLLVKILLDINFTLKFLLGKCGLLGLIIGVVNLVAVLITALNLLLVEVGILVVGLLASVKIILPEVLGMVGCILCALGLILV